jgi:hypothetical protein
LETLSGGEAEITRALRRGPFRVNVAFAVPDAPAIS